MTVINPNSISGITSITMPSGDGNVLTIHTNDGTERFRIDSSGNVKVGSAATISPDGDLFVTGVCTATTLSGAASGLTGTLPAISGANLTNLPAANITGTLPAISATNLTNVPAANITGTLPAIDGSNLTGIGGTDFIHAEQISVSGITTSNYFVPTAGHLGGRRNIIINGACMVAQRGTSSTSSGYLVDRHKISFGGLDESPTMSQHTLTSSDTGPYAEGFRKSFHVTNGNQTSGLGSSDEIEYTYRPEAQDLLNSGWNYTSSSSFVTLSFWVKSSVAQNFFGFIRTMDSPGQGFAFETGSLTADTWKKVIIKIPGNSNIVFNDDTGEGMRITICLAAGSDDTDDSVTLETWGTYSGSARTKDTIATWFTTNDSTFELTGLQLEVGPEATPFEHRSKAEELLLCQRYYRIIQEGGDYMGLVAYNYDVNSVVTQVNFIPEMRATPTIDSTSGSDYYRFYRNSGYSSIQALSAINGMNKRGGAFNNADSGSGTAGQAGGIVLNNSSARISFDAEI